MKTQYTTILDLVALMTTTKDIEWLEDALFFVNAAFLAKKSDTNTVALCQNPDGTAQSWRNLAFRSSAPEHELRLPSDYVEVENVTRS